MLEWLLLAAVLVGISTMLMRMHGLRRSLPAAEPRPALVAANQPLHERMRAFEAALADVRAALDAMTPATAQRCAWLALARVGPVLGGAPGHPDVAGRAVPHDRSAPPEGPGTELFVELLAAIAAIDADDRRELTDVGLDPGKLVATFAASLPPERWERELTSTLEFMLQGLNDLRTRRYG